MTLEEKNTEEKIFEAAKEVFTEKGFDGSRMEEISKKAGINKALLHYYYRTKEKLFNAIFEKIMGELLSNVEKRLYEEDAPLEGKIEFFVETYMNLILKNPHIPMFILNELNRNPEKIISIFKMTPIYKNNLFAKFKLLIQSEIDKGNIKPIAPEQLVVNILSLTIFPVVARPIIQVILFENNKNAYNEFIESRKKEVAKFIIASIKK